MDESSIVLMPNKRRVINTKIVKYTPKASGKLSKRAKSLFGFMSLNGKDSVMMTDRGNAESLVEFLKIIKSNNPQKRIVVICDNARIHHAKDTGTFLNEENIVFVFLPPYSPDLNPIEFAWKDVKKQLSRYMIFDEMIKNAKKASLQKFSDSEGYSKKWVDVFGQEYNDEKLKG